MTREGYAKYYDGEYRRQVRQLKKRDYVPGLEKQFERGRKNGIADARLFLPFVKPGLTVDVGSGSGAFLSAFQEMIPNLEVAGIEPCTEEAEFANRRGIKTYVSLFENFKEPLTPAANIMSTRNLNHLLDPRQFLVWTYDHLEADGRLILSVQNFRLHSQRIGKILPQIDHTYYFLPETLRAFVEAAGFEILFFSSFEDRRMEELERLQRAGITTEHVRLAARKTARGPFTNVSLPAGMAEKVRQSMSRARLTEYHARFLLYRAYLKFKRKF